MNKRSLDSRENIHFLVSTFYTKVRKDELLSPIFNTVITDWEAHIERLTDFWQTNLLFVRNYKGNPIKVHQEMDQQTNESITQVYFGIWLQLWFETLEEHFEGQNVEAAKNRARTMSTHLFFKMFGARKS